jgi:uncharacterized protein (UPF0212 family)
LKKNDYSLIEVMASKCDKCGVSVMKEPLLRTNPLGEMGIFWCMPCIEANEPELASNIKEDEPQVMKDLKYIFYSK